MKAKSLVYFKDNLTEEEHQEHYGILLDDGSVQCLHCGGILEEGDYIIIKNYNGFPNLENILGTHYGGAYKKCGETLYVLLNPQNGIPDDAEADALDEIIETQLRRSTVPGELQKAIEDSNLKCIDYGVLVIRTEFA